MEALTAVILALFACFLLLPGSLRAQDSVFVDPYQALDVGARMDWMEAALETSYPCVAQTCFVVAARDTFRVISDTLLVSDPPLFLASMWLPGSPQGYVRCLQMWNRLRICEEDFPATLHVTAVPFESPFFTFRLMWHFLK